MLVQSIMIREVISVKPETLVSEAAKLMKERGIRCLVVTENGEVKGVLTDSDIIFRVVGKGHDPTEVTVAEMMTKNPETIDPETDIFDAVKLMEQKRIRRLPVIQNDKLVGLISVGDIAANLMVRMELLRSTLPEE